MENNQYMYDIQAALSERTIKRMAILNALLAVALTVNVVLAHIRKR